MPAIIGDRVLQTTATTGAGTYSLGSAVAGFQTFLQAIGIASGDTVAYAVLDSLDTPTVWEIGLGVITTGAPATLTRATILESTSGTSAISWASGTKYVLCAPPARLHALKEIDGSLQLPAGLYLGGTAAANHMAIYEEGSWTPTLIGSTTPGAQTYVTQAGRYIRIGNLVWVAGRVQISAKDGAMAGNLRIGGLPFSASNISSFNPSIAVSNWQGLTFAANYHQLVCRVSTATSLMDLFRTGSGETATLVPVSELAAAALVDAGGTYRIN